MAMMSGTGQLEATPVTQGDVRELAEALVAGKITADQYFDAVRRRAERLVDDEAADS